MFKVITTLIFALIHHFRHIKQSKEIIDLAALPKVSILIAAYNEEIDIADTLESIIECSDLYNQGENYEIIVVDDGSKDKTAEIVSSYAKKHKFIRLIQQENGGKASALNTAISHSQFDIIVSIDADSFIDHRTLINLTKHFSNPKVGAVAGQVKVANLDSWLTHFQLVEYCSGQHFDKRAQAALGCVIVVPGAAGAFRKEVVLQLGGYSTDTITEDMDLTIEVEKLGYQVIFEPLAIGWTEAPLSLHPLIKQRVRWMYGTFQVIIKHRKAVLNPRFKTLGLIGLPTLMIFGIAVGLVTPFLDIFAITTSILDQKINQALLLGVFVLILEILIGAISLLLGREKLIYTISILPQRLFFRVFVFYVITISLFRLISRRAVQWDKLKRLGIRSQNVNK